MRLIKRQTCIFTLAPFIWDGDSSTGKDAYSGTSFAFSEYLIYNQADPFSQMP